MSLYSDWKARAENLESDAAYQQYWSNYFSQETEVYKKVLQSHDKPLAGTVKDLSEQVGMDPVAFMGYLDGANTSFADGEKDLESLTEESEVTLNFDFEKLFFNMHEAKADWLFNLPAPQLTSERTALPPMTPIAVCATVRMARMPAALSHLMK